MLSFRLYLFFSINSLMFRDFDFVFADKLCVDPACTEPISEARGTVHYIGDKSDRLSFKQGKSIIILSKSKKEGDYWGALIDGNRGYVPSHLIQETKVYYATDKLVSVPNSSGEHLKNTSSEAENDYSQENFKLSKEAHSMHSSRIPSNSDTNMFSIIERSILSHSKKKTTLPDNLNPTFVVSPYDVIEGTTVYDEVSDHLAPSSTFETAPSSHTVMPNRDQRNLISESQNEKSNTEVVHTQTDAMPNLSTSLPHTTPTLDDNILSHSFFENETDDGNVGGVSIIAAAADTTTTTTVAANKNDDDNNDDGDGAGDDDYDDDDNDDDDDDDDDDGDDDDDNVGVDYIKAEYSSESNIVADGGGSDGNNETKHAIPVEYSNEEIKHLIEQEKTHSKDLMHEKRHFSQVNVKKLDNAHEDSNPNEELTRSSELLQGNKGDNTAENVAGNNNLSEWETNSKNHFTHEPVQTNIDVAPSNPVLETETTTDEILHGSTRENVNVETEFTEFSVLWDRPNNVNPSDRDESQEASPQSSVVTAIKEMLSTNILESGMTGDGDGGSSDMHGSGVESRDGKMEEFHIGYKTQSEPQVGVTDQETINKNYLDGERHKVDVIDASDHERTDARKGDTVAIDDTSSNNAGAHEPSEPTNIGPAHVDNTEEDSLVYRVTDIVAKWFATRDEESDGAHVDSKVYSNSPTSDDPDPGKAEGRRTQENEAQTSNLFGDNLPDSNKTFIYLVVTAVTVLLFTLGHSLIEKKEKSGPLIAKINKLEQKLFVTSKECLLLKDEIEKAREKISLYENSSNDELIISLRAELEEAKRAKTELESSVEVLQQELDSATEAGLDLNKMLSEVLTQKGGSESLLESVENLQAQLDSQQKIIDEMTNKLGVKNEENESLQLALDGAHERAEALEEELGEIKSKLSDHLEEKESMARDLKSQIDQLHSRIDQLSASKEKETGKWKKLFDEGQKTLKEKSDAFVVKEKECEALKASLKQVRSKGNQDLSALFDVCRARAEVAKMEEDGRVAQMELDRERSAKRDLENRVAVAEAELKKLESLCEAAKQNEEEAQKKLEVLSTYFKEKETQLQKELGCQEALWAQKKGDEKAVYSMLKSLQEEVESYKSQNETLKQEILDQERGLKTQMAGLEQKAHENWVAARQAERRLEESKQETAQLRNRLTLMEKISSSDGEGKPSHRVEELNGVEAASPALHDTSSPLLFPPLPLDPGNSNLLPHGFVPHPMFMPPPMSGFMPPPPPPPPPFLPGDRRPPPLGRMSSPPLNSQFSPPPPPVPPHDYAFDRMPSPPPSPHGRSYRSPSDGDREKERSRHKTPLHSAAFPHRTWEESHDAPGFIPISSQRDSKREPKGSKVSSGHSSSDSLDHSNARNSRM